MQDFILPSTILIVWRESFEAVLLVGLLMAGLRQLPVARKLNRSLIYGVILGLGLSLTLASGLGWLSEALDGKGKALFDGLFYLLSAALMVQMVFWLERHSTSLKSEYHEGLKERYLGAGKWGVVLFVATVIAREGSETVIYLYGMNLEKQNSLLKLGFNVSLGVGAAILFSMFVNRGLRGLSPRSFFRWTGIFLLISASGLAASSVRILVDENIVSGGIDPLFNVYQVIDPHGVVGSVMRFLNLNLKPSLIEFVIFLIFWILIYFYRMNRLVRKVRT